MERRSAARSAAVISFTRAGGLLAERICTVLTEHGFRAAAYRKGGAGAYGRPVEEPLGDWAGRHFGREDLLVFVGACGIAVRAIAPYVRDKRTDPAVLVLDEKGGFCIPLLSGHLGGANEAALLLGRALGCAPVLTTATDVNGAFAVDVFAARNRLAISDMGLAKAVSAAILRGEDVGFRCDGGVEGPLPAGLRPAEEGKEVPALGICIATRKGKTDPFPRTLYLIPRAVTVGIGCRRGTERETIAALAQERREALGLFPQAIRQVASIDLKRDEPGLLAYCEAEGLPLRTYSAEELAQVPGEFTSSDFVRSVAGVDNVCERSACRAAQPGRLLEGKTGRNGVTVAFAEEEWRVRFE